MATNWRIIFGLRNAPDRYAPKEQFAKLFTPDEQSSKDIAPGNGKSFTLEELQGYVGGYIEMYSIEGVSNLVAIFDEEGRLKKLPLNVGASAVAGYQLVGPVVICTRELAGYNDEE